MLKLKFSSFKNIKLGNLFIFEDKKGIKRIIEMSISISVNSLITHKHNNEVNNQSIVDKNLIDKIENNLCAKDVLHFYEKQNSWINFYKIYELILDKVGNKKITEFISKKDLKRFTGTAQARSQIGDEARHAGKKFIGHPEPMTIIEVDNMFRKLIYNWLNSL